MADAAKDFNENYELFGVLKLTRSYCCFMVLRPFWIISPLILCTHTSVVVRGLAVVMCILDRLTYLWGNALFYDCKEFEDSFNFTRVRLGVRVNNEYWIPCHSNAKPQPQHHHSESHTYKRMTNAQRLFTLWILFLGLAFGENMMPFHLIVDKFSFYFFISRPSSHPTIISNYGKRA